MSSKSRLGRGLGALFPTLSNSTVSIAEQEREAKAKAAASEAANEAAHSAANGTVSEAAKAATTATTMKVSAVANEAASEALHGVAGANSVTGVANAQESVEAERHAGAVSVSRETSTSVSRETTTSGQREIARNVSRETMRDVFRETSVEAQGRYKGASNAAATRRVRHAVPHFDEIAHPSDMFFQDSASGIEQHIFGNAGEQRSSDATGKISGKVADKADTLAAVAEMSQASTARESDNAGIANNASTVRTVGDAGSVGDAEAADSELTPDTNTEQSALRPVQGGYLAQLDIHAIVPNEFQPRMVFRQAELRELARSIREVGVLQPIVVRAISEGQYELIMGERRWRASQLAGLTSIPAIVKTTADNHMLRDALLENLHRVALNPLEEAAAYQQMIQEFHLTQEQLAQSVSKSRPQIANIMRLLHLPIAIQRSITDGKLSAGHARALLGLSDERAMLRIADKIAAEGLSVRRTEALVAQAQERLERRKAEALGLDAEAAGVGRKRRRAWLSEPEQQHLDKRFGVRVAISGSQERGKIEIPFASAEDRERIVALLMTQPSAETEPKA